MVSPDLILAVERFRSHHWILGAIQWVRSLDGQLVPPLVFLCGSVVCGKFEYVNISLLQKRV